ncbi:unnamed protein product [Arctogadus glacialis]
MLDLRSADLQSQLNMSRRCWRALVEKGQHWEEEEEEEEEVHRSSSSSSGGGGTLFPALGFCTLGGEDTSLGSFPAGGSGHPEEFPIVPPFQLRRLHSPDPLSPVCCCC